MNFYHNKSEKEILAGFSEKNKVLNVNGHIHTPYSFSAFRNIEQPFIMAVEEGVKVLGINDFYTFGGYEDFYKYAERYKVFPMFNVEFIGLDKDFQKNNIKVNDPNNPGRIYFSGKGISFPLKLDEKNKDFLFKLKDGSNNQTKQMAEKLNEHLINVNAGFLINYEEVLKDYVTELSRERHLAKAIREEVFKLFDNNEERLAKLKVIYSGSDSKVDINNEAAVENELRANLLKSGGPAFVEEEITAFPEIKDIISFIKDAGGIPCYPVLLDDKNGNMTDFEGDWQGMYDMLTKWNVNCLELIPGRNSIFYLEKFVKFFNDKGVFITFGTEHNTPELIPVSVKAKDSILSEFLKKINYDGACIIAAHQYKSYKNSETYNFENEIKKDKEGFIKLGKAVINNLIEA